MNNNNITTVDDIELTSISSSAPITINNSIDLNTFDVTANEINLISLDSPNPSIVLNKNIDCNGNDLTEVDLLSCDEVFTTNSFALTKGVAQDQISHTTGSATILLESDINNTGNTSSRSQIVFSNRVNRNLGYVRIQPGTTNSLQIAMGSTLSNGQIDFFVSNSTNLSTQGNIAALTGAVNTQTHTTTLITNRVPTSFSQQAMSDVISITNASNNITINPSSLLVVTSQKSVALSDGFIRISNPLNIYNLGNLPATSGFSGNLFKFSNDLFYNSGGGVYNLCDPFYDRDDVTQTTDITTSVDINTTSGTIITVNTNLAAGSGAPIQVFNTKVLSTSLVSCQIVDYSGTLLTNGIPYIMVSTIVDGSFFINLLNIGSNAFNGVLKFQFIVR